MLEHWQWVALVVFAACFVGGAVGLSLGAWIAMLLSERSYHERQPLDIQLYIHAVGEHRGNHGHSTSTSSNSSQRRTRGIGYCLTRHSGHGTGRLRETNRS
jgi:hypothetical protein